MSGAAAVTTSPKLCYSLGGPARVRGEPEIQVGIDTIAKRYFPAIVCLLLLVVAYFQARGVTALVAGELPPPSSSAKRTVRLPAAALGMTAKAANAGPILARNAFDSVTGPLDGVKLPAPAPVTESGPKDPTDDPPCASGSVVLIADSVDPAWSFAVIRGSGNTPKMRRIGDDVDGQLVKAIAWDRVWLASGGNRCQLQMLSGKKQDPNAKPPPMEDKSKKAPPPPAGDKEPETTDLAGDVRKVSDTEFIVAHNASDKIATLQKDLMKHARLVPGKGIRLSRAPVTSALGQLGMTTGDIIKTINGFDMMDPDKAIEGYTRLKTASEVSVGLERNGAPMTINIKMQ